MLPIASVRGGGEQQRNRKSDRGNSYFHVQHVSVKHAAVKPHVRIVMLAFFVHGKEDAMLKFLLHAVFGHNGAGMMIDPNGGG